MIMAMAMGGSILPRLPATTTTTTTTTSRIGAGLNGRFSLGFSRRAATGWWRSTVQQQQQYSVAAAAAAPAHGNGAAAGGRALRRREAIAKDAGLFGALREKSMFSILSYLEDCSLGGEGEKLEGIAAGIIGAALLFFFAFAAAAPSSTAAEVATEFKPYYGTAASASSYGGYGGNSNKQSTAEYTFEVPEGWKEKTITKIEKGTNGTDAEFDNPKHKDEKVYVTYLANFRQLAPIDRVLDNLALSDPVLQDIIAYADGNIKSVGRKDSSGQQYYDYEIESPVANVLVSVTCAKNKLYAHFVKAGPSDWARDQTMLRHLHDSFQTVGNAPLGY